MSSNCSIITLITKIFAWYLLNKIYIKHSLFHIMFKDIICQRIIFCKNVEMIKILFKKWRMIREPGNTVGFSYGKYTIRKKINTINSTIIELFNLNFTVKSQ